MNFKKTVILAFILCFVILVYYLIESPLKNRKQTEQLLFIPGFSKEPVAAIVLASPDKGKTQLKKTRDGWLVEAGGKSYPADTKPIASLLDTTGKLRVETVVSKNPGKHQAFEVDARKGVEVKIEDDSQKTLAHFYIGKSGPDLFSTYVRLENSQQVVLTNGILKTVFERELKDWRDKTIFSLNQPDIVEYQVKGDKRLHLKATEKGSWEVLEPEKFSAKKSAVDDCTGTFASLSGVDFAEGALKDFQLDRPVREVTVRLKGGSTKMLLVGKEKNAYQHYAKAQDAPNILVLENYKLEQLTPDIKALKEEEQKKAAAGKAPSAEKKPMQQKPPKK